MKTLITIIIIAITMMSCNTNTGTEDYKRYYVRIINDSSSEITNINFEMVGAEKKILIDNLTSGSNTEFYKFLLKNPVVGQQIPISYGDYHGSYIQKGEEKYLGIISPFSRITIKINETSFVFE